MSGSVVGWGSGGGDESTDVIPDEDDDRDDRDFSFSHSLSFLDSTTAGTTGAAAAAAAAGATVAALLGFRPLLPPPPPPTAFRFPLPVAAAGTGAGVGTGAIAAGLGAIGLNLSMILPICHAAPACCPAAAAAPYLGAMQHPPFLSIASRATTTPKQAPYHPAPTSSAHSLARSLPLTRHDDHHRRNAGETWGRGGG